MTPTDTQYMQHALSLGAHGLGQVWPNPSVGCVIVNDGRIVGRGRTAAGGRPHGETVALAQAGDRAKGSTAYVTMEPCAHHGQTPPCAEALIAAGIVRVVLAISDPDPRVDGSGVALLRAAGIEVVTGVCEKAAFTSHAGFLSRIRRGRPMVTLKLAASLDGRIATATGESKWITGVQARRVVHALRARHDAVMVGGGTARADDPSLTVREMGIKQQPVRVIWSRHLDLPLQGQLAKTARKIPVWILHGQDADPVLVQVWRDLGATMFSCEVGAGRQIDPRSALQKLGKTGLTRVFCEGGGALAASLLSAGMVDELICFTAGIGLGAEGQPMLGALGLGRLDEAPRFDQIESRAVGDDVMTRWRKYVREDASGGSILEK